MKQVKFGDMLQVTEGILVHGCNAQGVMGSGIALAVKTKYPVAYEQYNIACKKAGPTYMLGTVVPVVASRGLIIANAVTQLNFGREPKQYVSYKAVQECFMAIAKMAIDNQCDVHYPLLGAGLGGGDWAIISEIIDTVFVNKYADINRTLWIYE